ncbi:DUF4112 domain-containing protein [Qipengyuania sp. 6B39]|uniref:DUF4112 domain-containing protein n=1 Tax=Qipengyuania proteolytica TaxID=2867239 RepID=UPI001C8AB606|nr:DUF4112 domain-containing protein [Qipengyuania proteolytica]MBX7494421.1 DUF4112 domain-containing protein [Qipengyuania proteolytica]
MTERPTRLRPMGIEIPTGTDPHSIRRRIEAMEQLLERSFVIPGTRYPVGLDSIIGLIPVVGDAVTAALAGYIVWEAKNLGIPRWKLWRMIGNIAFDSAVGAIPVAGDAFDLFYKSNSKNLRIVKKHLDKHHPQTMVIEG